MTDHIDDYDEKTVPEVKDAVRDAEFAATALEAIAEYERDHEERVTLLEWLDRRTPEDDEDEREPIVIDGTEYDNPDPLDDRPAKARVAALETGSIAGHHFDRLNETKTVEVTPRVVAAINDGRLQRIQER